MLVLSDAEVRALVSPDDAIALAEEALAARAEAGPSSSVKAGSGRLRVAPVFGDPAAAADLMLHARGAPTLCVEAIVEHEPPALRAVVASGWLACLAAGATSAVAARRLARRGASTVGLIGCGQLAEAQLACLRAALGPVEAAVYCRTERSREAFGAAHAAEPLEYGREAGERDVVVTATSSRDPVLRGDWLRPGSLVCASGAVDAGARELDNGVLERAAFVCCDDPGESRRRAGDLVEPVEQGLLDWLEVHALAEVLSGALAGRQADDDVVLLKTVGVPGLRLALARLAAERAA